MSNVVEDISKLTTLSVSSVKNIINIVKMCISHEVLEAKLHGEDICTVSLGDLGKLIIRISEEELAYKFIPSASLERELIETLNTKESSLERALEDALMKKVISVYKDLL